MAVVGDLEGRGPEPEEPRRAMASPDELVLADGATLNIRRDAGSLVVEVSGLADGSWADALVTELLELDPEEHLVIDVNAATLVNPASLCEVVDELLAAGSDPHRVCIVCERLSAVVLLRRYGVTEQVAVFTTRRDALQAAVLHHEGYGEGWVPVDGS